MMHIHDHAQLRFDTRGRAADVRRAGTGRWLFLLLLLLLLLLFLLFLLLLL